MAILTAVEVFDFAIRIEENGAAFYRKFADRFDDSLQRELFHFLASEETRHRDAFDAMSKEYTAPEGPRLADSTPGYGDEYADYLKAYAERLIFAGPSLEKELSRIKSVTEACEFGIRRELDSILYYQEIKSFVPERERAAIDDVITEERRHFMKLTELKRELQ